jgi:hypothetical protein
MPTANEESACLERVGSEAWAEQAQAELRTSGETLMCESHYKQLAITHTGKTPSGRDRGARNTTVEPAAALSVGPNTIEFHLSNIHRV